MAYTLSSIINTVANVIILAVFINWILQFFLSPFHPVRELLNRFIQPMLDPIRRMVPPAGGLDFSPMILWILVILIRSLLINFIFVIF